MDRETMERIDRAPAKILVEIKQRHIDECTGRWTLTSNAISLALSEVGWPEASISMFNAFIGKTLIDLVCYKPETETSSQIQAVCQGRPMTPFIAGFNKEKRP